MDYQSFWTYQSYAVIGHSANPPAPFQEPDMWRAGKKFNERFEVF